MRPLCNSGKGQISRVSLISLIGYCAAVHGKFSFFFGLITEILLEYDSKKKIGAFVSGPSEMRHEVASICGSGLANNLHFESCSFSW